MSVVFISYRREDSAGFAGRLYESLERRLGDGEVFRDADAIEPGQDFVDAIAARLRYCNACLVLIGREWLDARDAAGRRRLEQDDDYVRLEIAGALARSDVVVIPVLVEGMRMPRAADLPESIRALSRRQAVELRDQTWDADVDRLVGAIRKSVRPPTISPTAGRTLDRRTLKWLGVSVVAVLALIVLVKLGGDRAAPSGATPSGASVTQPNTTASSSGGVAAAPAYAIAIPRLAEVANGRFIYTLLSGGITPRGSSNTLRLRVRLSNEGRYPANFWVSTFRLAVQGQVLSPTNDLNEVVDGYSVKQGIVAFDVPSGVSSATLRVLVPGKEAGDLPLDLRSIGTRSDVEKPDTSDAGSRAIAAPVVREPRTVVSENSARLTLMSVTARRFVNTLRIIVTLRMEITDRYPRLLSSDAARLIADGQSTAPFEAPSEAVAGGSTATADFLFDVAPSVKTLRLLVKGDGMAEVPLDLPSVLR